MQTSERFSPSDFPVTEFERYWNCEIISLLERVDYYGKGYFKLQLHFPEQIASLPSRFGITGVDFSRHLIYCNLTAENVSEVVPVTYPPKR